MDDIKLGYGGIRIHTGPITENKIYETAIKTFGINTQSRVFVEECAEAIVEVMHYYNRGRGTLDDVASELADVEIMLAQMKLIVNNEAGEDLVENYKQVKLLRLETNLKEEI
jgi:NTP pyrophosphatase (non-canonical NTP hydrolase)